MAQFSAKLPSHPLIHISTELVAEVAKGLDDPEEVAARYGVTGAAWEELSTWQPFLNAVASQQAAFRDGGQLFQLKARILTEDVFEKAYLAACSDQTTLLQKLEFIKTGMKLGDMEPKQAATASVQGSGFSVNIVFSPPTPVLAAKAMESLPSTEFTDIETTSLELEAEPCDEPIDTSLPVTTNDTDHVQPSPVSGAVPASGQVRKLRGRPRRKHKDDSQPDEDRLRGEADRPVSGQHPAQPVRGGEEHTADAVGHDDP